MALYDILKKVKASTGWSDATLDEEVRALLLDKINEACEEIYEQQDLPVILKEVNLNIVAWSTIALPPFIGEVRAIRNRSFNGKMKLFDIRPRYASSDWPIKWNAGRIIGESAIAVDITSAAPISITYPVIDSELTFTVIGETDNSNRAIDIITMDALIKTGTKQFTNILSIKKNKLTDYDALVTDSNNVELALIYADQFDSRYIIMDISQYPNLQDCSDGTYIMEILYKPRLNLLLNDQDEFPLRGYDHIIALKAKQLMAEDEEGKEQRALLMYQKAKEKLDNKIGDKSNHTMKKITHARNPLLGMFKVRSWRRTV